jgi:hypothetical protein
MGIGAGLYATHIQRIMLAMIPHTSDTYLDAYSPRPEAPLARAAAIRAHPAVVALMLHPNLGVTGDDWPAWCEPPLLDGVRIASRPLLMLLALHTQVTCKSSAACWFTYGYTDTDLQELTGWDQTRTRDTIAFGLRALTDPEAPRGTIRGAPAVLDIVTRWAHGEQPNHSSLRTYIPRLHATVEGKLARIALTHDARMYVRCVALALEQHATVLSYNDDGTAGALTTLPFVPPHIAAPARRSLDWLREHTTLGIELAQGAGEIDWEYHHAAQSLIPKLGQR